MLTLGIETTCDETAASVVKDGKTILSNVISSQVKDHEAFGGVVPELACRLHVENLLPVIQKALIDANCSLQDIDLIAVARGPGLIGALLIGLNAAKTLSIALKKPLIGVNHIEAHLYASFMSAKEEVPLPALGFVISGGHTAMVKITGIGQYELIGQTIDDAIGEAFDKVASILGLPYPGGPSVEKLALQGDPSRFPFKAGHVKGRPFDFSFSGLKTAVLYQAKGIGQNKHAQTLLSESDKMSVAASFQRAALEDIASKACLAAETFGLKSILFGGGVSNNQTLRKLIQEKTTIPAFWPEKLLCLDNGAMIAGLGTHHYLLRGQDPLDIAPLTRIPF